MDQQREAKWACPITHGLFRDDKVPGTISTRDESIIARRRCWPQEMLARCGLPSLQKVDVDISTVMLESFRLHWCNAILKRRRGGGRRIDAADPALAPKEYF